nr:uncharacterized mitochondrial protein AtMg00810-like [Tanacetum cinerariifolium]
DKGDILLVQVYVDDIIFGSTKKSFCIELKGLMHKTFQMSSMGELTFFLGLQVMQRDDEIFISQDKYVVDILKKFNFFSVKRASTPIETNKALLKDKEAKNVDVHLYRSMIGSLMYLTAYRPDIMFVVFVCAKFQVTPNVSHLHAMKRIFRYLKGRPKLGLWYPRDSPFDLEAFLDSYYVGASLDRKSTTEGCQFLRKRLISWQCKKQTVVANSTTEVEYVVAANCCRQVDEFGVKTAKQKLVPNGCLDWNETAANDEIQVSVVGLTYYWEAQIQALVDKKKVIITEASIRRDLRVESSAKEASLGDQEDASKQWRKIDDIDQDAGITLVDETQERLNEEEMCGVTNLDGDEVIMDAIASENVKQSVKVTEKKVSTADPVTTTGGVEVTTTATTPQISKDKLTLAQTLIEIKAAKPKAIITTATTLVKDSEKAVECSEKAKEGSSKREGSNLEQEDAKRQRLEEENESAEHKRCLEIIPKDDDDVTIKATPLSSKSPNIVDYKINKEGRKIYFKIIRAAGNSQSYLTFGKMFKKFNREDLEVP